MSNTYLKVLGSASRISLRSQALAGLPRLCCGWAAEQRSRREDANRKMLELKTHMVAVSVAMRSIFLPTWLESARSSRARRVYLFERLWTDSVEFQAELRAQVPRLTEFHHALEMRGDIEGALETGVLPVLLREKLVETQPVHLTPEKLTRGAVVWSIRWLGHGTMAVDRSGPEPTAGYQWHRVILHVRVDRGARRIDTEFYSLNEEAGATVNPFDDREKLHAVWCVPEKPGAPLELVYLGFGTNEPYDIEHADRGTTTLSGRPRFYIYDADRGVELSYKVSWSDSRPFDWDWTPRQVTRGPHGTKVEFVRMGEGTLLCLADAELASAAQQLTEEKSLQLVWSTYFDEPAPALSEVSEDLREKLRAFMSRVDAHVTGPCERPIGPRDEAPSIDEILLRAGRDYLPYFAATSAARTVHRTPVELLAALRQLDPSRADEYRFLDETCKDVFVPDVAAFLPDRLVDVFALDQSKIDPSVAGWVTHVAGQIDRDLYHYGQSPMERIHRLRFGAWLATRRDLGNVYGHVLAAGRACVDDGSCHGCFDLDLGR